jgi:hypothetical protein
MPITESLQKVQTPNGSRAGSFLKCRVRTSPFEHEFDVLIEGMDHQYESFIDKSLVDVSDDLVSDERPVCGKVKVSLVADDSARDAVLVELPRQVVMGGRRIWVPRSSLEIAE